MYRVTTNLAKTSSNDIYSIFEPHSVCRLNLQLSENLGSCV